ncbi:MAG: hypothetical protein IJY43_01180 [Clostridia bacterium]|nr:hypothetical protein [Clostridia bacterium]
MLFQIQGRAKTWLVFLFAALALLLFLLLAPLGARLFSRWFGLMGGVALVLFAGVFFWFGTHFSPLYLLAFLLNTAGSAFCAATYYRVAEQPCIAEALFPAVLLPLALLFLCCVALTAFPDTKEPIVALFFVLEIALAIASVVFWIKRGGGFYAFSLFSHLIALFYTVVYSLTVNEEERAVDRDVAIGSFGAFALVGVAAFIIALLSSGDGCDCDCIECSDCCDCGGSDKKGKHKKK